VSIVDNLGVLTSMEQVEDLTAMVRAMLVKSFEIGQPIVFRSFRAIHEVIPVEPCPDHREFRAENGASISFELGAFYEGGR